MDGERVVEGGRVGWWREKGRVVEGGREGWMVEGGEVGWKRWRGRGEVGRVEIGGSEEVKKIILTCSKLFFSNFSKPKISSNPIFIS